MQPLLPQGTGHDSPRADNQTLLVRARSLFARKKEVSFDWCEQVHEIPGRYDLLKTEVASIFYTKQDYKRMSTDRKTAVKALSAGTFAPDDEAWGLETKEDSDIKHRITEEAITSVLVEQEFQLEEEGETNAGLLAEVYVASSFASQSEAHQRALQVEEDVHHYAFLGRWGNLKRSMRPQNTSETPVTPPKAPVRQTSDPSILVDQEPNQQSEHVSLRRPDRQLSDPEMPSDSSKSLAKQVSDPEIPEEQTIRQTAAQTSPLQKTEAKFSDPEIPLFGEWVSSGHSSNSMIALRPAPARKISPIPVKQPVTPTRPHNFGTLKNVHHSCTPKTEPMSSSAGGLTSCVRI
jgi:hypothetical protein